MKPAEPPRGDAGPEALLSGPPPPGTLLVLATFGLEIVEVGGTIARHVQAGGTVHAAVTLARRSWILHTAK
jgi:hypothetical protein